MIGNGFSIWFFIVSPVTSSSFTKSVPEPVYVSNYSIICVDAMEFVFPEEMNHCCNASRSVHTRKTRSSVAGNVRRKVSVVASSLHHAWLLAEHRRKSRLWLEW